MKLNVLLGAAALLGAFLLRSADGRPADDNAARRLIIPRPLLLRLGEEFSLQLGGSGTASSPSSSSSSSSSSSLQVNRALLQLTQRLLQARAEQQEEELEGEVEEGGEDGDGDKGKRSEESPLSLDLTFHLLREVLEMARAEQMAQQADSNRKLMDTLGK